MAKGNDEMGKTGKSEKATAAGGRPKGAANIERPTATAVPAHCPACGNTAHRTEPGAKPIVYETPGVSNLTGQPYRFVVWRKVMCDCGQHFRIREEANQDPREGRS